MLRLLSKIVIQQKPLADYPDRSESFTFNFVNECTIKSSWRDMTTTAKLILPRRLYFQTSSGSISTWGVKPGGAIGNILYGEGSIAPILARGDTITMSFGYWDSITKITTLPQTFSGFISKINPKVPLEIECDDFMYVLKQALAPNKVFDASKDNTQSILKYLIHNPIMPTDTASLQYYNTVIIPALKSIVIVDGVGTSAQVKTNVGNFQTKNESIANVLQRLRKDYKVETFFRDHYFDDNNNPVPGNGLYVSGIVYYPTDYINTNGQIFSTLFDFQKNIISTDNLTYQRKDDIRLGIRAYSVAKEEISGTTASGATKTKKKRLEVTVGDTDGDVRTQYFWSDPGTPELNLSTLTALANQRLSKLKYEGWKGKFTTFGLPQVKHGQVVTLNDEILPERNGIYLIKSVITTFGINGFRQEIEPHIRIDTKGFSLTDFMNGI